MVSFLSQLLAKKEMGVGRNFIDHEKDEIEKLVQSECYTYENIQKMKRALASVSKNYLFVLLHPVWSPDHNVLFWATSNADLNGVIYLEEKSEELIIFYLRHLIITDISNYFRMHDKVVPDFFLFLYKGCRNCMRGRNLSSIFNDNQIQVPIPEKSLMYSVISQIFYIFESECESLGDSLDDLSVQSMREMWHTSIARTGESNCKRIAHYMDIFKSCLES